MRNLVNKSNTSFYSNGYLHCVGQYCENIFKTECVVSIQKWKIDLTIRNTVYRFNTCCLQFHQNLKYLSDTTMRLRGPLLIAAWHGFFCLIRSRILLKRTLNKTVPRTFYRLCVNRFGDVTKIVIFSDYII